ncbi:MAG TPA: PQQ-binding-like beta-propeller repeat protein [Candidatus Dormibacteraeota bacterium]
MARFGVGSSTPALDSITPAWSASLDAAQYAQPVLALGHVFAATENDSVYSFDATTGALAWRQHLGDPIRGGSLPCGNIDPSGITSTPVVDPATATIYAAGFVQPGRHVLWALDTATGAIRWQRTIDPPALSPRVHQQRSALTLSKGRVYVPYGGLWGDCGDYRGWVVASAADGSGDLLSYRVKSSREGGIWAPGGAAVDPAGNLFVSVGNAEGPGVNYGNAVIRLTPDLAEADYWAPANWASLNASDTDVGSITPALLQNNLVFQAGKAGIGYLIRANPMGGVGGEVFSSRVCNGLDYGAVAYAPPFLYVPCRDVGVTALKLGSSRFDIAWKVAAGGNTPVVAGGWLWTIGGTTLVQVALDSGAVKSRTTLPGAAAFATVSAGYGRLYVPAGSVLIAFGPAG